MPSPFPGMDPYMEDPWKFPTLHTSLITFIMEQLQPDLPENYLAGVERRAWVETDDRNIQPDGYIEEVGVGNWSGDDSATATLERTATADEPMLVRLTKGPHRQSFLEIRLGRGREGRLVTVIEVLSPMNKNRSKGRKLYQQKQEELFDAGVNLVEIDLLRAGAHVTAVPDFRMPEPGVDYDYHVCVHRPDRPLDYEVYPVRLQDRLPRVSVPLLPEDGDVVLDIQAAVDRAYAAGPWRKELDYTADPPPPQIPASRLTAAREVVLRRQNTAPASGQTDPSGGQAESVP